MRTVRLIKISDIWIDIDEDYIEENLILEELSEEDLIKVAWDIAYGYPDDFWVTIDTGGEEI